MSVPMPFSAPAQLAGRPTPQETLEHCTATTRRLKASPLAYVQLWLQNNVLSAMPRSFQRKVRLAVSLRLL